MHACAQTNIKFLTILNSSHTYTHVHICIHIHTHTYIQARAHTPANTRAQTLTDIKNYQEHTRMYLMPVVRIQ